MTEVVSQRSVTFWLMAKPEPEDHLTWKSVAIDGRSVHYGVAGSGLPVLFVHGWALGQHAYKRALKRLVRLGCRVYAPALPGFGGSSPLPPDQCNLEGYAAWLDAFLSEVGVDEPVFAVGHSFGGGVATKLAHDFPARVGYLVLINSVGGGTWLRAGSKVRSMAERPLWDWAINFPYDLLMAPRLLTTLRALLEDAIPNIVRNPLGVWRVGSLARRADLTADLAELKARQLPVLVLWGEGDGIIPRASFEALCAAVGSAGKVVPGRHTWLLADPDSFGEVMANSVTVAQAARTPERGTAVASRSIVAMRGADASHAAR
jgi:pimeloyl-ACP methyl ester carboxylesterase